MCPGSVEAPAAAGAGAEAGEGKTVCEMDAAGPLDHALVDRLLRRGYTIYDTTYIRRVAGLLRWRKKGIFPSPADMWGPLRPTGGIQLHPTEMAQNTRKITIFDIHPPSQNICTF
jgi:hypothetical protein